MSGPSVAQNPFTLLLAHLGDCVVVQCDAFAMPVIGLAVNVTAS